MTYYIYLFNFIAQGLYKDGLNANGILRDRLNTVHWMNTSFFLTIKASNIRFDRQWLVASTIKVLIILDCSFFDRQNIFFLKISDINKINLYSSNTDLKKNME